MCQSFKKRCKCRREFYTAINVANLHFYVKKSIKCVNTMNCYEGCPLCT